MWRREEKVVMARKRRVLMEVGFRKLVPCGGITSRERRDFGEGKEAEEMWDEELEISVMLPTAKLHRFVVGSTVDFTQII